MTDQTDDLSARLTEMQAKLDAVIAERDSAREALDAATKQVAEFAAQAVENTKSQNREFVESLVRAGRLTPANRAGACAALDTLSGIADCAEFAAADGKTLIQYFSAPTVVKIVCTGWLGIFGGILAMLGVVAAPITSGDTALRSARLIIAEALHLNQRTVRNRLMICVPVFAVTFGLLMWQISNPDGFNVLWQYFGWSNQTLSVFTLWAITVYLAREGKAYVVTLIPALVMTAVCTVFLLVSPQALALDRRIAWPAALVIVIIAMVCFFAWHRRQKGVRVKE